MRYENITIENLTDFRNAGALAYKPLRPTRTYFDWAINQITVLQEENEDLQGLLKQETRLKNYFRIRKDKYLNERKELQQKLEENHKEKILLNEEIKQDGVTIHQLKQKLDNIKESLGLIKHIDPIVDPFTKLVILEDRIIQALKEIGGE